MPIVVDSSGQERYVTQEEVPLALESGYQLKTGERLEVVGNRGTRGSVSDRQAVEALAQTYTPASRSILSAEDNERYMEGRYGGFSGRGILEGAARGATLGLSDLALTGLGVDREGLEQRRERGTGTTLAELGGAIVPGLLTGGAGAAAGVAKALPAGRAAVLGARAGQAAGGGIRGLVVQGAAEGAMFTAGQSVSDLALSDDPVTAEALVAEAGDIVSGTALGGAAGGALGLGGKLVKRFGERSRRLVNEADRAASLEVPIVERETNLAQLKQRRKDLAFQKGTERHGRVSGRADEKLELQTDLEARKGLKRATREAAKEQGATPAESFKGSLNRLEAEAKQAHGKAKKLSRFDWGEKPDDLRAAYDDFVTAETRYKALVGDRSDDALRSVVGRNLDEFYEAVAAYEKATVRLGSEFLEGQGLKGLAGDTLDDVYDDLVSPLHHLDRAADDGVESLFAGKVGRPKALAKDADSELQRIRARLRELAADKAKDAPVKLDPELHALDQQISREALAVKLMKEAKKGKPIPADFLDIIAGADELGEDVGVDLVPGAAGMILKIRAGRHLKGIAGLMPGKLGRAAGWAAEGAGVLAGARQSFHRRVASAVDGMVKAKGGIAKAAPIAAVVGDSRNDRFQKRMQELSWAMGNPDAHERRAWDNLAPVRALDLKLADQMIGVEKRKVAFLHSKAPKNPGIGNSLQQRDKWKPGAAEVSRFLKMAEVVDDPVVAFERAASGRLTMDDVEALRAVYPEVYQAMRLEVVARVQELRQELPYAKRVQLSMFFGVPVDSIMRPEVVQAIQAAHAVEEGEGQMASQQTGQQGGNQKALNLSAVSPPEPTRAQGLVAA